MADDDDAPGTDKEDIPVGGDAEVLATSNVNGFGEVACINFIASSSALDVTSSILV